ncbi:hypothetical protein BKA83DRAFT_686121 [Pisolithus microcarpus]|nr:hypothetical protein BKA83DRAFT_686121 [Pisolithus microcarpus]
MRDPLKMEMVRGTVSECTKSCPRWHPSIFLPPQWSYSAIYFAVTSALTASASSTRSFSVATGSLVIMRRT